MRNKIKNFFYQIIIVKPITSVLSIMAGILLCYFLLSSNYYDKYIDCDLTVEIVENRSEFRIDKDVFNNINDKNNIRFFYENNEYTYVVECYFMEGNSYCVVVNEPQVFIPKNTYSVKIFTCKDKLIRWFI